MSARTEFLTFSACWDEIERLRAWAGTVAVDRNAALAEAARLRTENTSLRAEIETLKNPRQGIGALWSDCGCARCDEALRNERSLAGNIFRPTRMNVCRVCGNKRCPKAGDHRYACTGSNESGQIGSPDPAFVGVEESI